MDAFADQAVLQINIGGQPVPKLWFDYLISVRATDREDGQTDECHIVLDDSYGQLRIPIDGEDITILMGWPRKGVGMVFHGVVMSAESGGLRSEGRTLTVIGTGTNMKGMGKVPLRNALGSGKHPITGAASDQITLGQMMELAASAAGYSIRLSSELAQIKRPYWSQNNESFFHYGQRMARELGGVFKVSGMNASITTATDQSNALGKDMATITATWGDNLLWWRIRPIAGRPSIRASVGQFFDLPEGKWKEKLRQALGVSGSYSATSDIARHFMSTGDVEADQEGGGPVALSSQRRGTGTVSIIGDPSARSGGTLVVSGARSGVDGSYRITEAEHDWARTEGYVTTMTIDLPNASGGTGVGNLHNVF